jgi:hypothetical protein
VNLLALQTEVEGHGFDPIQYGGRIIQYLNDAQNLVARRVQYWLEESTVAYTTTASVNLLPLPLPTYNASGTPSGGFGRLRELFAVDLNVSLQPVALRDVDNSVVTQGRPYFYAMDGPNLHLYPTPDGSYPFTLRYWIMPTALANSTDIPGMPADWHHILWRYAVAECYKSDDDQAMGQYWTADYEKFLAMFEADARFPSTDWPTQAESFWNDGKTLSPTGNTWTLYGGY